MAAARLGWPRPGSSVLFLCDLQERFRGSVAAFPQIVAVAARLLQKTKIWADFGEGFWGFLGGISGRDPPPTFEPPVFGGTPGDAQNPRNSPQNVAPPPQQTALDLLERGLDVHVVADAVSSRSQVERALALSRMREAGAHLSTCESLLLLLLRDAAHPKFRQILPLIKEPLPDTGLILGEP
ncbi:ISC2A protein, partial [Molothrus ater]|nr:ISC2A protein [Molothrus ater]